MNNPADARHLLGQHFTPQPLVRLVCSLGIRTGTDRVLDPACGDGAFLRGTIDRLQLLGQAPPGDHQVCGFEIDPQQAETAAAVAGASVQARDFFSVTPAAEFDAIVGNFPFVRQELMARKDAIRKLVQAEWLEEFLEIRTLSGRPDLYLYFFLHAARFLREGGRMAVISGNSWLHVPYGRPLRRFLLTRMSLRLVLESRAEVWFPNTVVNAVVTVADKLPAGSDHRVRFVQASEPLAANDAWANTMVRPYPMNDGGADIRTWANTMVRPYAAEAGCDASAFPAAWPVRETPASVLAADDDWHCRLRAPAIFYEIIERAAGRLVPLRSVARIKRGITTGLNEFFFIGKSRAAELGIEPEFLVPVIASLKNVKSLVLRPEHATHCLLAVDRPGARLAGTNAMAYILQFERSDSFRADSPTLRSRAEWFRLKLPSPADLLLLRFRRERHFSPANPAGMIAGDTVFTASALSRANAPLLWAAANCTLFHFFAEVGGRDNMGGGFLTTYGPELRALRVPAPPCLRPLEPQLSAAFNRLAVRDVTTMEHELSRPDRRALDELIWQALGLPPNMLDELYRTFGQMLAARRRFGEITRGRRSLSE
ncbi:MAG TPA: N-6 DNA methylase [Planctomycetota bacterium]|nr:N-6 DNA methylase [Planctomycetota bacterium]